tara:strand:- start:2922 stop:3053 length:132 start_codon:yes stop_codon:yes gene_type:complete
VHGQIGIIVDERIGPDTGRQEYLVHFMNGEKHYVYRKEIKYVR